MWHRQSIYLLFNLITITLTAPSPSHSSPSLTTLYTFPSSIWIENLVVHSPSTIILSQLTPNGALYTLNPLAPSPSPSLIHAFPATTNLLGITNYAPSSYAFVSLEFNATAIAPVPGSQALWTLNLANTPPEVTKLVDLPNAGFLNGLTTLSTNPPRVLISDSLLGAVWRVDIDNKEANIVLQDDATMLPDLHVQPAVGINGVRYDGLTKTVFYTNTAKGIFASIAVDPQSGKGVGSYDVLSTQFLGADDFGISEEFGGLDERKVYVTGHATNQFWGVVVDGGTAVKDVLANITMPTSAQAGWGEKGEVVYITTAVGEILEYTPVVGCDDSSFSL
jgi:hypothetical protein